MSAAIALFVFGVLSGFVLTRLRRGAPSAGGDRLLVLLAWIVTGAAFTLAALLFGFVLIAMF